MILSQASANEIDDYYLISADNKNGDISLDNISVTTTQSSAVEKT